MGRFFAATAIAMMNQEQGQSQEQGAGFVGVPFFTWLFVSYFSMPSFFISSATGPGSGRIPLHPMHPEGIR